MSLLSVTAHWLYESFVLRSAMLNAANFRGSHTSEAIAASLKDMFDKWQIPLSKVHVILRDNASNTRKAMDNMGVRSVGCVAHTMQLVVNGVLLSQRAVSDAVACGRKNTLPPTFFFFFFTNILKLFCYSAGFIMGVKVLFAQFHYTVVADCCLL